MPIFITLELGKNLLDHEKKFMCAGNYTETQYYILKLFLNPKSFWNYIKNLKYNNYIPSVTKFINNSK